MEKVKSREQLEIDRKIVVVSSLFSFLGIGLLLLVVMASNSMSALRSFSTLQSYWTESRKEAAYQLEKYVTKGEEVDLVALGRAMRTIESATAVRRELSKKDVNTAIIRENMLETRLNPEDIENMVTTFRRLESLHVFQQVMQTWQQSDSLAYRFYAHANRVANTEAEGLSPQQRDQLVAQIQSIDDRLSALHYQLASLVSESANLLNRIIIGIAILLGGILLIIALILLFRILNSIKRWSAKIRESEQRYKSLFEQNPNAVYSMDKDGNIIAGNSIFAKIFKNGKPGYAISHFSNFFDEESPAEIQSKIARVKQGEPVSFEVNWKKSPENVLCLHNTVMPIIIDEYVAGMFGIAEDVTYAKQAELKINQQLKEKTVLLAEIHHRVKNNLAIISGLLELQEGALKEEPAIRALVEAKSRIQSIAMIHEKIYENESLADINVRNYIEELTRMIEQSYRSLDKNISLHIDVENITITLDQSIPCALILNELICNAYEHAFDDQREGNIWISFTENNDGIVLTVIDDGTGLPENWQEKQLESLGLVLVETLTEQLEGDLSITIDENTRFDIKFDSKVLSDANEMPFNAN